MHLTQKETMYLKDAKSHEELCVAKYNSYSNQVSDLQLSALLKQIAQHEQQHLNTINQMLQGQIPTMGGSGGQQGQQQGMQQSQLSAQSGSGMQATSGGGQQMQSGSNMSGQPLNDQQICQDLLTTEKAIAAMYNTATFEFTNPQLRQVLAHIQQEEQEHAYQLYDFMAKKGWYQAQ